MNVNGAYWKIKSAALERQLRQAQLHEQAREVDATFAKVMTANGLDPQKNYKLNDADESVTEEVPDGDRPA
jgi:hypothetical protein